MKIAILDDYQGVALSMADLGASLTSGYPVSSSPSRTSAAEAAGSTTQLTGIRWRFRPAPRRFMDSRTFRSW